jgi:signal transduction histidine kinase
VSRLPIRIRLTLPFAAAMALVLAALGGFVYLRVGSNLLNSTDQTLFAKATEATIRLERGQAPLSRNPGARVGIAQVLTRGRSVSESQPSGLPPLLTAAELGTVFGGRSVRTTVEVPGRTGRWRLLAIPVNNARGRRALVLASSLDDRAESLERLRKELLVGSPLALLLATLAGYVLAGAALRPVEEMRRKAGAISASTPGSRLPVPPARDEISRLAETLNDMLERLETAFEHERRFVADASHELRTPLALLRTELELALRHPRSREELEDALRSAVEETDRLTSLAADLLLIARSDQGQLAVQPEPTAASELLDAVGARFAARAEELGRDITVVDAVDAVVEADARRVEQALGNLVDNALVHGRGAITLAAVPAGDRLELHVRDEGPGFPAGFATRAFDRFSRADEARPRPGSGLGLAIVQTIAQAHGGSAGVSQTPGDADVWISLPLSRGAIRQRPQAVAPYLRS